MLSGSVFTVYTQHCFLCMNNVYVLYFETAICFLLFHSALMCLVYLT